MHQDDEGPFASNEIDEELEEGINDECLRRVSLLSFLAKPMHTS